MSSRAVAFGPALHPVIGELRRYRWSHETGFLEFSTATMHGFARVSREPAAHLEILSIAAATPMRGDGGRFLRACQEVYDKISVWEINSAVLEGMLTRRGFTHVVRCERGETLSGLRWRVTSAVLGARVG